MPPHGVYAAVLVPRGSNGELDERGFRKTLEFLVAHKTPRVVVNGATGEYPLTSPLDLGRMLTICRETLTDGEVLCGIGSAALPGCLESGYIALDRGASALLLPMPHFFPYSQDDLQVFCAAVAGSLDAPVLLYNLPKFTTPLELETVECLIASVPNIIGIKDSSGSLSILRSLKGEDVCRIVGDDSVLVDAVRERVCDGVISGVAGVLPELIAFLYHERDSRDYQKASSLLRELIGRLSVFPVPWGLKLIAECRGVTHARFLQPLSRARTAQAADFRAWFTGWWPEAEQVVRSS